MTVAIWWIRRDLRLEDNPALEQASRNGAVIPVFILDNHLLTRKAPRRQNFLFRGLCQLNDDLRNNGTRLIVRRGDPLAELTRLVSETGAEIISAGEDFSPYARLRDERIGRHLPLRLTPHLTLHHPVDVHKVDGNPYTIFTPFKKKWLSLPLTWKLIPIPKNCWHPASVLASEIIPAADEDGIFPAGEKQARFQLDDFFRRKLDEYAINRDLMAVEGTSLLSPYLRFGMISPSRVFELIFRKINSTGDVREKMNAETWLNELIWREFYQSILFHFPQVTRTAFRPSMRDIHWNEPGQELSAWREGTTGFPIVDAGMRQLVETGWMHNRARMITASFLVKDLLINWQLGEEWFYENLIDGDPASNNGGWQWVAGTGTDAAPYFRVFNPVIQGKRFDPLGNYIRRWVPELARVPSEYIHAPWLMPTSEQIRTGCIIGKDYPFPIVDHAVVRGRVMSAYRASVLLTNSLTDHNIDIERIE